MKFNLRAIHRDLGYLYMGLIISFAFSGIMMNHRQSWHADKYTVESKEIKIEGLPANKKDIDEAFAKKIAENLHIKDKFRRHNIKKEELSLSFENNDITIDLKTGKGEIVTFKKTPIISQMMFLHKNTSNWWIYFSDIFGISLITIAITGSMLFKNGSLSFKKRGWMLTLMGIIFPLVFLFVLS